jgi:hypothetical protein
MSAKEKARELFNKMYHVDDPMGNYPMCFDTAKQCALIAVDEMISVLPFTAIHRSLNEYAIQMHKYLEKVKEEIEKI